MGNAGKALDPTELGVLAFGAVILWQPPLHYLLLILPIALVSIAMERAAPYRTQRVLRGGWRTDICHAVVSNAVSVVAVGLVAVGLFRLHALAGSWLGAFHAQPELLQGIEAILLGDLAVYAEHRLSHRLPLLWRFHSVHHSTEELDWLSGYRAHPVDLALSALSLLTPFVVLGSPGWAFAAYKAFDIVNTPFAHANLRMSLGPFWWVVRNPEVHRWHHAKERLPGNSNFALVFPIWDVIFRTVCLPRDRALTDYGITEPMPGAYLGQILTPFRPRRQVV